MSNQYEYVKNYIDTLSVEILYKILLYMKYDDIISYCETNKNAMSICHDVGFWSSKLNMELYSNDDDMIKPSHCIHNYQHFDKRGYNIYKRWKKEIQFNVPDTYKANIDSNIKAGYNDIVIWFITCNMKHLRAIDFKNMANTAISNGNLEIFDWFMVQNLITNNISLYSASANGHLNILKYTYEKRGIIINNEWRDGAITGGHMNICEWLKEKGNIFTSHDCSGAIMRRDTHLLEWLEQIGILPNSGSYCDAAVMGYVDMLDWLESRKIAIYKFAPDEALEYCNLDVLNWFYHRGYVPHEKATSSFGIYINNRCDILEWLEEIGIRLSTECANSSVWCASIDSLEWLKKRGILPNRCEIHRQHPKRERLSEWIDNNVMKNGLILRH